MVDRALDSVVLARGLLRVNFVVVGCPRLKIIEAGKTVDLLSGVNLIGDFAVWIRLCGS
jgi:hypothetical protein